MSKLSSFWAVLVVFSVLSARGLSSLEANDDDDDDDEIATGDDFPLADALSLRGSRAPSGGEEGAQQQLQDALSLFHSSAVLRPTALARLTSLGKENPDALAEYASFVEEGAESGEADGKTRERAVLLLRDAARRGSPRGHGLLAGALLGLSLGLPLNRTEERHALAAEGALHAHFGAAMGDRQAMLITAFRSMLGLGVRKSCAKAMAIYASLAAEVVRREQESQYPIRPLEKVRLGEQRKDKSDLLEFYEYIAGNGNSEAQYALGHALYHGTEGARQDGVKAFRLLSQAAERGNAAAHALLGHMYLRGAGVGSRDLEKAFSHFTTSANSGHRAGRNGLGLMHYNGLVPNQPRDLVKARDLFKVAAADGLADANFNYGVLLMEGIAGDPTTSRDPTKAVNLFRAAERVGHLLSAYNLGIMLARGLGAPASCPAAVSYLKSVAERGPWITSLLERAQEHHHEGRDAAALVLFQRAAEMGSELAQSNAAYLLKRSTEIDALYPDEGERARRIVRCYLLASEQEDAQATTRLADMTYLGLGTEGNLKRAASIYARANTAEAQFNLGMMHHMGLGIAKDPHLAKRFYDRSLELGPEGKVPVTLALWALFVAQWAEQYSLFGFRWDSVAIAALSLFTVFLIFVRSARLRGLL